MARQRHRAAFITGAVLGGLTGAAITLWRAPQSGRETRAQIGAMITSHAGPLAEPLAALAEKLNDAGEFVLGKVTGSARPEPTVAPADRTPPAPVSPAASAPATSERTVAAGERVRFTDQSAPATGRSVPATSAAPTPSPATDTTTTTPTVASVERVPTASVSAATTVRPAVTPSPPASAPSATAVPSPAPSGTAESASAASSTPNPTPATPPRYMPPGTGYHRPQAATTRGGTAVNVPPETTSTTPTEPIRSVAPMPLTEEEREALDLDPVIEPEELEQRSEGGKPLAAVQAELARKRQTPRP